jgi:hypothetical protein
MSMILSLVSTHILFCGSKLRRIHIRVLRGIRKPLIAKKTGIKGVEAAALMEIIRLLPEAKSASISHNAPLCELSSFLVDLYQPCPRIFQGAMQLTFGN